MPNDATKETKSELEQRPVRRRWLFIAAAAFLLLLFAMIFLIGRTNRGEQERQAVDSSEVETRTDLPTANLTIGNDQFTVELARSEAEKAKGLSSREELDEDAGMLFVYDTPGDYQFWMKDTLIPLDIIWLDANQEIVDIAPNVQPGSYPQTFGSEKPAQYVLELNGDESLKRGIAVGDQAQFNL